MIKRGIENELKRCLEEPGYFYKLLVKELEGLGISEKRLCEVVDLTRETINKYRSIAIDYETGAIAKAADLPYPKKLGDLVKASAYRQYTEDFREILAKAWLILTAEAACNAKNVNLDTTHAINTLIMIAPRYALGIALQGILPTSADEIEHVTVSS